MNDAEYERQVNRIHRLEERWIETLGLTAWKLTYVYVRSDFTMDGKPAPDTMATAKTDWQYMLATISWNMPVVAEHSDRELERIFLHEAMHIFVNELRSFMQESNDGALQRLMEAEHEERVCTMLGNAFLWTRESLTRPIEADY